MSESPINPVAPALANAVAGATGIRFTSLSLAPDRIYRAIFEKFPDDWQGEQQHAASTRIESH